MENAGITISKSMGGVRSIITDVNNSITQISNIESRRHVSKPLVTPPRMESSKRTYAEPNDPNNLKLRSGAVRILRELVSRFPAGYTRSQVGTLTRFAPRGGTFGAYISDLRRADLIEERDDMFFATEAGAAYLGDDMPTAPTSHDEALSLWRKALRKGAYGILEIIIAAGQNGIERDEIAARINMAMKGGTFGAYLGDLCRNGLVRKDGDTFTACDILFP